ncbi:MAG: hypothetical protein ABEJ70_09080 [Halobacteriaceae archaeon]
MTPRQRAVLGWTVVGGLSFLVLAQAVRLAGIDLPGLAVLAPVAVAVAAVTAAVTEGTARLKRRV